MADWYSRPEREILRELGTGRQGLSARESAKRLEKYGENILAETGRLAWWQVLLAQFQDLLVVILMAAAGISMLTGDAQSAMVILAVLLLNAILGTVQHQRAEKSLDSLRRLSSPEARVLREGRAVSLPSSQVVPGDILLLETGDLAAADGRVLEEYGLTVNESSLTGESLGVEKTAGPLRTETGGELALADRTNQIFAGSLVTAGRGVAVVTATGMETEIGRIAALMNETKEQRTPLQISLDRFSGHLAIGIIAVCALVFGLSLYRREPVLEALMFAVALAVAAIPEALSSIVTIVQAMGTQRMAREHAIIKDLKAVESLGCVSVICSDKTGTLTQNRMSVERLWIGQRELGTEALCQLHLRADGAALLRACVLANNAPAGGRAEEGDPMEAALLRMAAEGGAVAAQLRLQFPRRGELPFDSERKMMSVINEAEGVRWLFTKGAVDVVLDRCVSQMNPGGGSRPLTAADRRRVLEQNERWSLHGLRVLAFGCRRLEESEAIPVEDRLTLLGMTAMMDPPRPESRAAVASSRQAGIRPVMITGDHPATALAVAEQIDLLCPGDRAVTGAQLNQMSEEELSGQLEQISVYARVSPEHKLRIVKAWQKKGRIVAMTGDGVNDAPALKQADIGVAMGIGGTEVSKDAASMILADDNFATIMKAVANGRNVYRNIKNAIQFLLSGNMAGILCVLYTSLAGLPLPFAPVHLLFINLITDSLPAIAIGMEPAEEGLLRQPPRDPKEGILTPAFVRELLFQGGLIAAATMWSYRIGLAEGGEGTACTMAFSTLTLARLFHGFNCRSRHSILRLGLRSNRYSLMAFGLGSALLAAVLLVPGLQQMLAAADLSPAQAAEVAAAAFFPSLLIQLGKLLREAVQ